MRVLVLGSGMVGSVVAADMSSTPGMQVTVVDASKPSLDRARTRCAPGTKIVEADASTRAAVTKLVKRFDADLVLGALPSRFGFGAMQGVIDARVPYVDISFMPEDFLELDASAKRAGVCVVADMGVAPGMSHMLCGWAAHTLDRCDSLDIMVGGLPKSRSWPWQYKAPFSPHDVIEEYVRTSRVVENGELVEKEALSEPELVHQPGVGTLEAFNTDGLRSLTKTLKVPTMREKTMRYPGHAELMRTLRHLGLFGTEAVSVRRAAQAGKGVVASKDKVDVRPLDVLAALLFPHWTYDEGEPDITVMTVRATGQLRGKHVRMAWTLHDELDAATGFSSMSRTTGFPATAVARMVAAGSLKRAGVHAPELLGQMPGVLDSVLADMRLRGVVYRPSMEEEKRTGAASKGTSARGKSSRKAAKSSKRRTMANAR